jgi:hypothetical protein
MYESNLLALTKFIEKYTYIYNTKLDSLGTIYNLVNVRQI